MTILNTSLKKRFNILHSTSFTLFCLSYECIQPKARNVDNFLLFQKFLKILANSDCLVETDILIKLKIR